MNDIETLKLSKSEKKAGRVLRDTNSGSDHDTSRRQAAVATEKSIQIGRIDRVFVDASLTVCFDLISCQSAMVGRSLTIDQSPGLAQRFSFRHARINCALSNEETKGFQARVRVPPLTSIA